MRPILEVPHNCLSVLNKINARIRAHLFEAPFQKIAIMDIVISDQYAKGLTHGLQLTLDLLSKFTRAYLVPSFFPHTVRSKNMRIPRILWVFGCPFRVTPYFPQFSGSSLRRLS